MTSVELETIRLVIETIGLPLMGWIVKVLAGMNNRLIRIEVELSNTQQRLQHLETKYEK
jgi:hypothetical protein